MEPPVDVDDCDLLRPPTLLRRCTTSQSETLTAARTIPGPAGIVQAAKLSKTRDRLNCAEEDLMATQEYIRKVVDDPEEDEDFRRNPWLSAIHFLQSDGGGMFSSASNLGEINGCRRNGKLDQVVAVIKSCTPNGLGDMTVELKDPTGTASGTIHHKVLAEEDFRKGICVGSVLILHRVSVFSPSRSTHYLNITVRNLVKVCYKDGGFSQKQTFHGTIDAAPHYEVSEQVSQTSGSAFHLERGAEEITNRLKRSNTSNEQENMNYSKTSDKDANLQIAIDKETIKEENAIESVGHLSEGFTNGVQEIKALLPDWTDEQLLQLSDWDDI